MNEINTIIENLGFPVACVFGLAWYVNKIHKETMCIQSNQMDNANKIIDETRESNKELMVANRELLETNRTLAYSINTKVDNIENNLIEIKNKLDKDIKY